jgi:hypothetical protein
MLRAQILTCKALNFSNKLGKTLTGKIIKVKEDKSTTLMMEDKSSLNWMITNKTI